MIAGSLPQGAIGGRRAQMLMSEMKRSDLIGESEASRARFIERCGLEPEGFDLSGSRDEFVRKLVDVAQQTRTAASLSSGFDRLMTQLGTTVGALPGSRDALSPRAEVIFEDIRELPEAQRLALLRTLLGEIGAHLS